MKYRPMLMSAPMVRAILDGRKTMTRRMAPIESVEISPIREDRRSISWSVRFKKPIGPNRTLSSYSGGRFTELQARNIIGSMFCPYGQPGDRLWVRETFSDDWVDLGHPVQYRADGEMDSEMWAAGVRWRPSIHMPRRASRITLKIAAVRVERLQDISEQDAIAEGCSKNHNGYYWGGPHAVSGQKQFAQSTQAFRDLWESINGPGSWALNPWVWVIEFKKLEQTA